MAVTGTHAGARTLLAITTALALLATFVVAPPPVLADDTPNLVPNGDFAEGPAFWWGLDTASFADGEACRPAPFGTGSMGNWGVQELTDGREYEFRFTARSEGGDQEVHVQVLPDGQPANADLDQRVDVGEDARTFRWRFTAGPYPDGPTNRVVVGSSGDPGTLCLSDIAITPVAELLTNPTFDGLDGWWTSNLELREQDGRLCGTVPAGGDPWGVILGQGGLDLEEGRAYTVTVAASAAPEASARIVIPEPGVDWPNVYEATITLRPDGQPFSASFVSERSGTTQFQIQLGGNTAPFELCIQLASWTTGGTVDGFQHETGPRVRVNQLGYLPNGPKRATLVTDAEEPVAWQLRDADGEVVASGTSTPAGFDASAGLDVHTIDVGGYTGSGQGYTLAADGEVSYPFDISATLYDQLRVDALGIYYTQRSGIEIVPIEVDGELRKQEYVRPAGHVSSFGGADVNQGDRDVPCLPNEGATDHQGNPQLGGYAHYGPDGWSCPDDYRLDLTGGWYDAGDHGKYVVNSGISVYQLLSTYERNQLTGVADRDALGDATLVIPERGNGVPDILDEVRWNLDWMLKMQVPPGTEMGIEGRTIDAGGLVHHKLHDVAWTGLNTLPHEDPMPRYVHRPSTAATLNLAATAAQGARLFAGFDADYADELLDAARRAWAAAIEHPAIHAPNTNDLDNNPGGGPYDDTEVGDEFYWAAAQLYLTTGEGTYRDAVLGSEYHVGGARGDIWGPTGFDWGSTAAAGRLDLATVPSDLPDRPAVIASVLEGAETYLALQQGEPFGHPYNPGSYDWGSTHQVINNAIVIATAYDLSGDERYLDAALEAIDYVLGRNAINNSYVKGYGTSYSQNMHSRWYRSASRLPDFPDGKLAGGPNSGIQDPIAQANLQGCAPQACYIDHIDSWSTNETTINWNAALAWYASWAADMGDGAPDWRRPDTLRPSTTEQCRAGGWRVWSDPSFRNQGQCVAAIASSGRQGPPAAVPPPGRRP